MRRWIGNALAWLLRINPLPREVYAGDDGRIIYTNNGDWREILLLHFLMPPEMVFFLPAPLPDGLRILLTGRQVIALSGLKISTGRQLVALLRDKKQVLLFPRGDRLFYLARGVAALSLKTGIPARPVITGSITGGVYAGEEITVTDVSRKAAAYKVYDKLRTALFWANHQEQVNFFDQLRAAARKFGGNKTIAADFSGTVSYKKLLIGSFVLGGKFRDLCGPGETVGTLLPTSVGHLITFFALCYMGKTPVILNFSSGSSTVVDCARLANVNCVITSRLFVEKAELHPLVEKLQDRCRLVYLEDVKQSVTFWDKITGVLKYICGVGTVSGSMARVILFTSGSENKPKGVVLKHANIIANMAQLSGGIDFSARDKMFNALPMFHSFGLTGGVVLPVLSGMETYLYPSPLHYKVIPELINRTKATILLGTPTFLMGYAKNAGPGDFVTLRYVVAGGEKLKDEIRVYWRDNFAINIMEAYGTTEAAPGLCISSKQFYKPGSVGRFVPGLHWRIQEVPGIHDGGNLMIKGPNVMEGYLIHGRGFVPAEDWYDCGDVIRVDDEGYCTIIARLKRFAKISGEMVSLNQVEEVAEQCFSTDKNAAVIKEDVKKGERIILFTTCTDANRQQFREFLTRRQLSMLLMPAELIVVSALPVLGNGKIDYVSLQATIADV